ncbi:MAG: hypothetical protein RSB91_05970 [Clostridia bacterium]
MAQAWRRHAPRLLAAATAIALFAWLALRTHMHFALSDDYYLARAFAGEVGGVPESYNLFVHTVFAYLLHALTLLVPGVWWFSWLQVALLLLATYGILLGAMNAGRRYGLPLPLGWLIGIVFVMTFTVEYSTSITFTTTAAALGAAAVWLLAGVRLEDTPGRVVRGVLCAAFPLLCAYMLRAPSALPALAFWVGTLLCRVLLNGKGERRFALKPVLCGCALTLALAACLVGIRAVENQCTPERPAAQWVRSNEIPIDYGALAAASDETLARIGWTQKERELALNWYLMDANMTIEAFDAITADFLASPPPSLHERLAQAKAQMRRLVTRTPSALDFFLLCCCCCMGAVLCSLVGGEKTPWAYLAPVGCLGVSCLLLAYLALSGRLPLRAAATVLLPACAMGLWLLARALLPLCRRASWRLLPAGLIVLCCAALALQSAHTAFGFYYAPQRDDPAQSTFAGVDAYALGHEELLLVGDSELGFDKRLFPDRTAGIPTNVLPIWGSWNNHSEGYRALFAQHGLVHDQFEITDFLRENVRLLSGGEPSEPFMAYLRERAGGEVQAIACGGGNGFTVYRFERAAQ